MTNFELAQTYITALTGSPDSIVDWRVIHDQRKDLPAHHYTGTLQQIWPTLTRYNSEGYGVFCNINPLDGQGRELANVRYIRAHVVDLDNPITARANYERTLTFTLLPHFAVQTSPNKFHVYWLVEPYTGNDFYTLHQRKLRQLFDGDRNVIDATRVLRVPGFYHLKGEPFLVTCWGLSNSSKYPATAIQQHLDDINVVDNFGNGRHELGDPSMAAPSLDWLKFAMSLMNPNDMARDEWLSFSAAIKQAGWTHTDDDTLFNMWATWCAQYSGNDAGENAKLWKSIRNTEVGWPSIERRTTVRAYMDFGYKDAPTTTAPQTSSPDKPGTPQVSSVDTSSEILEWWQCQEWFKDCYFINRTGEIFSPEGRFMNSTKFNGKYGGKQFIITSTGKMTDEAWKAALRSTCWTVPKVDHVRFLPDQPTFAMIMDEMGRQGLNTYIPARIDARQGDVTPFLDWLNRILPVPGDQKILLDYLAHNVKYPGHKIPWAPMLQSVQGIGKTIFSEVMEHCLGIMYVYKPRAMELVKSGSTFNSWQRGKLMIMVDEIRIDEKRDLIEILKPMVTDGRIEIQAKGVDQDTEDNPANWLFFSNYKDAIPINNNDRRFTIMYSKLQSKEDLLAAGMDQTYFQNLWNWLRDGGKTYIAHWLMNYPVERGSLPVRAPESSSHAEALRLSRSPVEIVIDEAVTDALSGFRGGYVSTIAALNRCKLVGGIRNPNIRSVQNCLEGMGYVELGRAPIPYMQEDMKSRAIIYGKRSDLLIEHYAGVQGYM